MSLTKNVFSNVSRETLAQFLTRYKRMIEIYTIILIILICTVTSSFFLGYMFGRALTLRHIEESKAYVEDYIHNLYEEAPTYNHTFNIGDLPHD